MDIASHRHLRHQGGPQGKHSGLSSVATGEWVVGLCWGLCQKIPTQETKGPATPCNVVVTEKGRYLNSPGSTEVWTAHMTNTPPQLH